jgi:Chaperone of endosialidase
VGFANTASGAAALEFNTTGYGNNANGYQALWHNITGIRNTASGVYTLAHNTRGSYNIGLGAGAGMNIVTGSNNIDIGGSGTTDESNTIRLGTNGTQKKTYIAGIYGTTASGGLPVEVTSNGQLVYVPYSARYKRDIRDIGAASGGLMKLRPVSFRYKNDPSGSLQYGSIAEEVARVYPEMVIRSTDGKVEGVRYLEFTALLLNELQKQAMDNKKLSQESHELRSEVAQVREEQAREHAAQQRETDVLKQKDAIINTLSERLAVLDQQVRTENQVGLRSLVSK